MPSAGMLPASTQHSAYLDLKWIQRFTWKELLVEFGGLGIDKVSPWKMVLSKWFPRFDETPAAEARGLNQGDLIIRLDDNTPVKGWRLAEARWNLNAWWTR